MKIELKLIMGIVFVCNYGLIEGYMIQNLTNYPADLELTVICQDISEKYHENTISLQFAPQESKYVPDSCWMKSMRAALDVQGVKKTTPVMSGHISSGQRSGLPPSWTISPAQENQYGQEAYSIQMIM